MNLNQNLFEGEQAKAAALAEANRALYTGFGNIASGVGTSLMNMQAQDTQMSNLQKLYGGGGVGNALKTWGGGGGGATAGSSLLGLNSFLAGPGRQIGAVIPMASASSYSAPSPLAPTPQPSFNLFGNLPQPR
jgi:hypothetical protein